MITLEDSDEQKVFRKRCRDSMYFGFFNSQIEDGNVIWEGPCLNRGFLKYLWLMQLEPHSSVKRWRLTSYSRVYMSFQCATLDIMFQKVDDSRCKILEGAAQQIMNKYLNIYENDVPESEWIEINIEIKKSFRRFDEALALANGDVIVGSRRGTLPPPAPPIEISDAGADKSGGESEPTEV
jgi:hypothetical protein